MHRTNITFDAQPNLTHIYQLNQPQFINWNVEWHKFPMLSHHRKCLWILNHAEYVHSIKSCVYAYNSTNIRLFNRFHHQLLHKIILKVLCLRLISLNIIQIHWNVHTYRICCQSCTLKMWRRHRAAVFHRVNGRQHGMPFETLPMKYEDEPLCTCVCVYLCVVLHKAFTASKWSASFVYRSVAYYDGIRLAKIIRNRTDPSANWN